MENNIFYFYFYKIVIIDMVKSLEERTEKLLSRTEALVLLTSKASGYWSMVKFCFAIPLVLTSSAMALINSITTDGNDVKIANIVVNSISVLIVSLNNSIGASSKCDIFKRLSQQLILLAGQIENDTELDEADFALLAQKYDQYVNDIAFEDIPNRFKLQVMESFKDRHLSLQLNGCSGNNKNHKRNSGELVNIERV